MSPGVAPYLGRRRGKHADVEFGEGDDSGGDLLGEQPFVELPAAFGCDEHRGVEHSGRRAHRSGPRSSVVSPASIARSSRNPGSA